MLLEQIGTQISTKEITFQPGGKPVSFGVTVVNNSPQFATFQVELLAAGAKAGGSSNWYSISPEVCTKKPPGDVTHFTIHILDTPRQGFTGLMTLTVRVFSVELREADSRQILRLIVPGSGIPAPLVELHTQEFRKTPGERFQIALTLESFYERSTKATLRLIGLNPAWLQEGHQQSVQLLPNAQTKAVFECQIPAENALAPSQFYPFTIEVTQPDSPLVSVPGILKILPQGEIRFQCRPPVATIKNADIAKYELEFINHSNLIQTVGVEVTTTSSPLTPEIDPEQADLSLTAPVQFSLTVHHTRPWWGRTRRKVLQAKAITSESLLKVKDDVQTLELQILPVIPFWLQLGGLSLGLLLILAGGVLWLQRDRQHTAPVNSVHFNGLATEVVSGADDQTVRRWWVRQNHLLFHQVIRQGHKAVRVVMYRPLNNDRLAIGFENGEIAIYDLLANKNKTTFLGQDRADDRVFDLVFTNDSHTLFSGHGSGLVRQWNAEDGTLERQQQVNFAVNALALVGEHQNYLAIAGRYNQLALWNLRTNELHTVPLGTGGQDDYIFSLATAQSQPYLLALGDNQGHITILNLQSCMAGANNCTVVDQWQPNNQAIHNIALSADSCYLATAGNDGKGRLWSLNPKGERSQEQDNTGTIVEQSSQPLNSIDVQHIEHEVLVVTGGGDRTVKLDHVKQRPLDCH